MWLLLCAADDVPALWAATRLTARGLDPLVVLTPELLHYSFRWEHRLHSDGASSVSFTLAGGRRIDSAAIRGVLNRLPFVPPHIVGRLVAADRQYALQEWTALHMSWLSSLRAPVLNLPVMEGLCGAWRHPSEWAYLAGEAGLTTEVYRQGVPGGTAVPHAATTTRGAAMVRTVIAIDGQGIDEHLAEDLCDSCGRLGVLAKTRLLGVDLDARTGAFIGASPRPDLREGGEPVIEALFSSLGGRA